MAKQWAGWKKPAMKTIKGWSPKCYGYRFRQQFPDDFFDMMRLQADDADNPLAINDGVSG